MRRLLPVLLLLVSACTKEPPLEKFQDAGAQAEPMIATCEQMGLALRSLAIRNAKQKAPESCSAPLTTVTQNFWVKLDCTTPEAKTLLGLYQKTSDKDRADPGHFPDHGDPAIDAFYGAAKDVVEQTSAEILRRANVITDGGCPVRAESHDAGARGDAG